jgi:threonine-phosphate decarboxylase
VDDEHGGNGAEVARMLGVSRESLLDLSGNAFLACTDLTRAVIESEPRAYENYPDPRCLRLRRAVASAEGVELERVLPGNGASDLIWLSFAALKPRRVVMLGPMFSEYVRACAALGIDCEVITPSTFDFAPDEAALRNLARAEADMAVVCLPNNPGGVCYPDLPALFRALAGNGRVVLADLSYREFLHGTKDYARTSYRELARELAHEPAREPAREPVQSRPKPARLVALHSLTKFFCCPGVRLGYALAEAATLEILRAQQPPWMVADFAGGVGARLFARIDDFRARLPALRAWRERMREDLAATGAFRNHILAGPSFVSARLREGHDAVATRDKLAALGVLVRACDTIPGMPPGFIRMQVRPPADLAPLYRALGEFHFSGDCDQ